MEEHTHTEHHAEHHGKPKSDSNMWLFVGIGAIVVVALVLIFALGGEEETPLEDTIDENISLIDLSAFSRVNVSLDDDPGVGNGGSPIKIVFFGDPENKASGDFYTKILPLLREKYIDTGKVRFVYRDFYNEATERYSRKVAQAAECADNQNKFWSFMDKVYSDIENIDIGTLKIYAQELGLGTNAFNTCLDHSDMASEVYRDMRDGKKYGLSGSGLFMNGIKFDADVSYGELSEIIDAELFALK